MSLYYKYKTIIRSRVTIALKYKHSHLITEPCHTQLWSRRRWTNTTSNVHKREIKHEGRKIIVPWIL